MPNTAIAIQTISNTIVGRLKFTVSEMVSNAAPTKFATLNHNAFICAVRLLYANAATMKKLPANPIRSAAKGDRYSVNVSTFYFGIHILNTSAIFLAMSAASIFEVWSSKSYLMPSCTRFCCHLAKPAIRFFRFLSRFCSVARGACKPTK